MIGINRPDIQLIANEYYDRLVNWLGISTDKDKLKKIIDDKATDKGYKKMLDFVWRDISSGPDRLILCKPRNLPIVINQFNTHFKDYINIYKNANREDKERTSFAYFKKKMVSLYGNFMEYKEGLHGYWLVKKLDIKTCPYCNRNYTFVLNRGLKARPEYDHFYPKADYPFLALSFYNLIPSCPSCNHLKKGKQIDLNPYLIDSQNNPIKWGTCNFPWIV